MTERPTDHRAEAKRAIDEGRMTDAIAHALVGLADDVREIRRKLKL